MAQSDLKKMKTEDMIQLSRHFINAFPVMDKIQQQIALTLYRELVNGKPVSAEQLANVTSQPLDSVIRQLDTWMGVFFDNDSNVIGFLGISIQKMQHHMIVNGNTVYVWCAWDGLFIPELLNATVLIQTACPVTNQNIELEVSPTHVKALKKQEVVVSFLKPDITNLVESITSNFCRFVHFFSDYAVAEQWCAQHPDTFLLSIDDAFLLGKSINTERFNLTLDK